MVARFAKLQTSDTVHYAVYDDSEKELPEFFEIELITEPMLDQAHVQPNHRHTQLWIIDDDSGQGFTLTVDDDAAKQVRKKHVGVPEGQSREHQVWMTAPPTDPVTVPHRFTGRDSDLASSSPSSHTFNDVNWFEPYRIELDAAQDSDTVNGMRTSEHTVVTDDPFYKNRSPRFVLVSERDNDSDQNGRATHSEDLGISPAVTATLEYAPKRHDGEEFFMSLRFSDPVRTGFENMRDCALQGNDAQVMRAFRIHGQSDLWGFIIRPRHNDSISLQIEGNRACNEQGAICSRAGSKRLGNTITVAIAGNNGEDAELPPGGDGVTPVAIFRGLNVGEETESAIFKVQLDRPALANTTVDFGVYSLTATDPDDYTWVSYQTIEIPQGGRIKIF